MATSASWQAARPHLRPTLSLLLTSLAILTLGLLLAAGFDQIRARPGEAVLPGRSLDRRASGERAVEQAQERLAARPGDSQALARLARGYLQRTRETGDPSYYGRAEALVSQALAAEPDEVEALTAAGGLALARHDFSAALAWGQRAVELAPFGTPGYGVMVDALVELGRYPKAVQTAQRMVDLRPELASYARVSYLRELHGDLPGALEAMRLAVRAGAPRGEATAWSEVQLGHLLYAQGDLDGAEQAYQSAAQRAPGYPYAEAGRARVLAARGDLAGAARLYERVVERLPLPEMVIALGDLYARLGDQQRAEQQYALVEALRKLFALNGARLDLELAIFDADHGRDLDTTLAAARAEYARRPSVQVADALAWVEYRRGDLAAALQHSREALRLGSRDPALLYRAGVIAQASGDRQRAYALLKASGDLNPRYSILWADDLAVRLSQLEANGEH